MSACARACSIRSIRAFAAVVDQGSRRRGLAACPDRGAIHRVAFLSASGRRRARRALCFSAPRRLSVSPNAGIQRTGLRLACAEPGDQLAIFVEALRELTQSATYLYEEAGRYWFSTQPTLNRLADDRAKALPEHEVDDAIVKLLTEDAGPRDGSTASSLRPTIRSRSTRRQALSLVDPWPCDATFGQGRRPSRRRRTR